MAIAKTANPIFQTSTQSAPRITVVIPAAGSGTRFGGESNKLFVNLAGRPLWIHAAEGLNRRDEVDRIVIAVATRDLDRFEQHRDRWLPSPKIEFTVGGKERSDTVAAAIAEIGRQEESPDAASRFVAVHDAARPLIDHADLDAVFAKAFETGAAILAHRVTGTLKRQRDGGAACQTVDRDGIWIADTPQVFRIDWIRQAYDRHRGRPATDDAQIIERLGYPVAIVAGSANNLKITYPEDLLIAEALIAASAKPSAI